MGLLTESDDYLHPPASPDRWWTETCWFSFDQPDRDLSATIYPLFRPNLNICSLGVWLWDASAHEPWKARYGQGYWHLAMPTTDLVDLHLEGLRYQRLEPLQRYAVTYQDGDRLSLELEYIGLRVPHEAGIGGGVGHMDQPCRVQGRVVLNGERIDIDCLGMRDRTWSVRPEYRPGRGTAYTYGHVGSDDQFLIMTSLQGNRGSFISELFSGYLVRDGVHSPLVDASRQVVSRTSGYPTRIEVTATDALGRRLEATGTTRNRLANQANPSQFAWMSMTAWEVDGRTFIGEDQEVWSPDMLGSWES